MNSCRSVNSKTRKGTGFTSGIAKGFTLIELLVVIAIIAILAAIIFPAFAAAQESARRSSCLSNMHAIAVAVKQYKLDNRQYPDFLFGAAISADNAGNCQADPVTNLPIHAAPGQPACSMDKAAGTNALHGLYPEYIKSLEAFHCPDNDIKDIKDATKIGSASRLEIAPDPTTSVISTQNNTDVYYKYDSYDANPKIADLSGRLDNSATGFRARYSKFWYPSGLATNPNDVKQVQIQDRVLYKRQLYFVAPSDDTYITMCPYHARNGKVTVLWLSGTAKVLDVTKVNNLYPAASPNDVDFWKLKPLD